MLSNTAHAQTATSNKKGGNFLNVLKSPMMGAVRKSAVPTRSIICKNKEHEALKEGVVRLYDALVTEEKGIDVNVSMIIEKGFPVFEEILGESGFKKVKKYYGIGCKPAKLGIKENEISELLEQLRTVENAQYYIQGYEELLENISAKLNGAPEEMTVLERAKIVRMYYTIFVGFHYFAQDFVAVRVGDKFSIQVDFAKAIRNNALYYRPECLFKLWKILISNCPDNQLVYDAICYELSLLDKKLFKEVIRFAELKLLEDGQTFVSVNFAPKWQKFSTLRTLKMRIAPVVGVYPMEYFACIPKMTEFFFDDLYLLYKILTTTPLENFQTVTKKESYLEGSREVLKDRLYYEIADNFYVSGQTEVDRFVRMFEYMAAKGYVLKTSEGKECNLRVYMSAFKFMHAMKYVDTNTELKAEFDMAEKLIEFDAAGILAEKYAFDEITVEEARAQMGVDAAVEKSVFGVEKEASPEEIAIRFAVDNGYADSKTSISEQLILNVVIPGNEKALADYDAGMIDEEALMRKMGFEDEFGEMYFDLAKVDIAAIEVKLQELKKSMAKKGQIKQSALLISLYCYLIEEEVPCGPKSKAPKRNKGLKPANLRAQIA